MEIFFSSISNREYAVAFLIIVLLLYCMIKSKDVTKSLLQVIKLMFFSKLTILFFNSNYIFNNNYFFHV